MAMLYSVCLTYLAKHCLEVEIDTLADTVVEKQARMQVGSLKNKLAKTKRSALLDKLVARLLGV